MNKEGKNKLRNLIIGAMLTAIGIMIPMVMPVRIVFGPASFTLASHVPVMIAMFFSPLMSAFVAIGTAVGFMMAIPEPTIWLRALSHLIFAVIGAWYLQKHPQIIESKIGLQTFNMIIAVMHAAIESGVVFAFYALGFRGIDQSALWNFLVIIGLGGIVHSFVDFNLAFYISKVLSKAFSIEVFDKAKELFNKKELVEF